jgi:hypothetical protein
MESENSKFLYLYFNVESLRIFESIKRLETLPQTSCSDEMNETGQKGEKPGRGLLNQNDLTDNDNRCSHKALNRNLLPVKKNS